MTQERSLPPSLHCLTSTIAACCHYHNSHSPSSSSSSPSSSPSSQEEDDEDRMEDEEEEEEVRLSLPDKGGMEGGKDSSQQLLQQHGRSSNDRALPSSSFSSLLHQVRLLPSLSSKPLSPFFFFF